jgi:hypothetical protein
MQQAELLLLLLLVVLLLYGICIFKSPTEGRWFDSG